MDLRFRFTLYFALSLMFAGFAHAATPSQKRNPALNDGPYVFQHDAETVESLWVCNGKVERLLQPEKDGNLIQPRCGYPHAVVLPPAATALQEETGGYSGQRIVAVSDIHGQFGILHSLLRAHNIIDANDHWNIGKDHLVITGDVFDRGPNVTEAFWLLFSLQQEAKAAGGAVHFLLGNHETMVLYNDTRYVNAKYQQVAQLLGRSYPSLYNNNSVLGSWLRTRPVLLKLGKTLFLHGGIAPESLDLAATMDATNRGYQQTLGLSRTSVKANPYSARLYDGKTSPIWYRGYFNGALSTDEVGRLVDKLQLDRIVVGHTTIGEVASFHHGRVIAIDSGIKRGKAGQLLFIEGDKLSRGLMNGTREPLPELTSVPSDKE